MHFMILCPVWLLLGTFPASAWSWTKDGFVDSVLSEYGKYDQAARADTVNDGVITESEFMNSLYRQADAHGNNDNKVSRDEFIDYYAQRFNISSELGTVMFDILNDPNSRDDFITSADVSISSFSGKNYATVAEFRDGLEKWLRQSADKLYNILMSPHVLDTKREPEIKYNVFINTIDANNDDVISTDELNNELKRMNSNQSVRRRDWVWRNTQRYGTDPVTANLAFDYWDRDRDLQLTPRDLQYLTDDMDLNGDNKVDRDEFVRFVERGYQLSKRMTAKPLTVTMVRCPDPWWDSLGWSPNVDAHRAAMDLDDDLNGWISLADLRRWLDVFDDDDDKSISRREHSKYHTERYGVNSSVASAMFDLSDINGDDKLNEQDWEFHFRDGFSLSFCDARRSILDLTRMAEQFRGVRQGRELRDSMQRRLQEEWSWYVQNKQRDASSSRYMTDAYDRDSNSRQQDLCGSRVTCYIGEYTEAWGQPGAWLWWGIKGNMGRPEGLETSFQGGNLQRPAVGFSSLVNDVPSQINRFVGQGSQIGRDPRPPSGLPSQIGRGPSGLPGPAIGGPMFDQPPWLGILSMEPMGGGVPFPRFRRAIDNDGNKSEKSENSNYFSTYHRLRSPFSESAPESTPTPVFTDQQSLPQQLLEPVKQHSEPVQSVNDDKPENSNPESARIRSNSLEPQRTRTSVSSNDQPAEKPKAEKIQDTESQEPDQDWLTSQLPIMGYPVVLGLDPWIFGGYPNWGLLGRKKREDGGANSEENVSLQQDATDVSDGDENATAEAGSKTVDGYDSEEWTSIMPSPPGFGMFLWDFWMAWNFDNAMWDVMRLLHEVHNHNGSDADNDTDTVDSQQPRAELMQSLESSGDKEDENVEDGNNNRKARSSDGTDQHGEVKEDKQTVNNTKDHGKRFAQGPGSLPNFYRPFFPNIGRRPYVPVFARYWPVMIPPPNDYRMWSNAASSFPYQLGNPLFPQYPWSSGNGQFNLWENAFRMNRFKREAEGDNTESTHGEGEREQRSQEAESSRRESSQGNADSASDTGDSVWRSAARKYASNENWDQQRNPATDGGYDYKTRGMENQNGQAPARPTQPGWLKNILSGTGDSWKNVQPDQYRHLWGPTYTQPFDGNVLKQNMWSNVAPGAFMSPGSAWPDWGGAGDGSLFFNNDGVNAFGGMDPRAAYPVWMDHWQDSFGGSPWFSVRDTSSNFNDLTSLLKLWYGRFARETQFNASADSESKNNEGLSKQEIRPKRDALSDEQLREKRWDNEFSGINNPINLMQQLPSWGAWCKVYWQVVRHDRSVGESSNTDDDNIAKRSSIASGNKEKRWNEWNVDQQGGNWLSTFLDMVCPLVLHPRADYDWQDGGADSSPDATSRYLQFRKKRDAENDNSAQSDDSTADDSQTTRLARWWNSYSDDYDCLEWISSISAWSPWKGWNLLRSSREGAAFNTDSNEANTAGTQVRSYDGGKDSRAVRCREWYRKYREGNRKTRDEKSNDDDGMVSERHSNLPIDDVRQDHEHDTTDNGDSQVRQKRGTAESDRLTRQGHMNFQSSWMPPSSSSHSWNRQTDPYSQYYHPWSGDFRQQANPGFWNNYSWMLQRSRRDTSSKAGDGRERRLAAWGNLMASSWKDTMQQPFGPYRNWGTSYPYNQFNPWRFSRDVDGKNVLGEKQRNEREVAGNSKTKRQSMSPAWYSMPQGMNWDRSWPYGNMVPMYYNYWGGLPRMHLNGWYRPDALWGAMRFARESSDNEKVDESAKTTGETDSLSRSKRWDNVGYNSRAFNNDWNNAFGSDMYRTFNPNQWGGINNWNTRNLFRRSGKQDVSRNRRSTSESNKEKRWFGNQSTSQTPPFQWWQLPFPSAAQSYATSYQNPFASSSFPQGGFDWQRSNVYPWSESWNTYQRGPSGRNEDFPSGTQFWGSSWDFNRFPRKSTEQGESRTKRDTESDTRMKRWNAGQSFTSGYQNPLALSSFPQSGFDWQRSNIYPWSESWTPFQRGSYGRNENFPSGKQFWGSSWDFNRFPRKSNDQGESRTKRDTQSDTRMKRWNAGQSFTSGYQNPLASSSFPQGGFDWQRSNIYPWSESRTPFQRGSYGRNENFPSGTQFWGSSWDFNRFPRKSNDQGESRTKRDTQSDARMKRWQLGNNFRFPPNNVQNPYSTSSFGNNEWMGADNSRVDNFWNSVRYPREARQEDKGQNVQGGKVNKRWLMNGQYQWPMNEQYQWPMNEQYQWSMNDRRYPYNFLSNQWGGGNWGNMRYPRKTVKENRKISKRSVELWTVNRPWQRVGSRPWATDPYGSQYSPDDNWQGSHTNSPTPFGFQGLGEWTSKIYIRHAEADKGNERTKRDTESKRVEKRWQGNNWNPFTNRANWDRNSYNTGYERSGFYGAPNMNWGREYAPDFYRFPRSSTDNTAPDRHKREAEKGDRERRWQGSDPFSNWPDGRQNVYGPQNRYNSGYNWDSMWADRRQPAWGNQFRYRRSTDNSEATDVSKSKRWQQSGYVPWFGGQRQSLWNPQSQMSSWNKGWGGSPVFGSESWRPTDGFQWNWPNDDRDFHGYGNTWRSPRQTRDSTDKDNGNRQKRETDDNNRDKRWQNWNTNALFNWDNRPMSTAYTYPWYSRSAGNPTFNTRGFLKRDAKESTNDDDVGEKRTKRWQFGTGFPTNPDNPYQFAYRNTYGFPPGWDNSFRPSFVPNFNRQARQTKLGDHSKLSNEDSSRQKRSYGDSYFSFPFPDAQRSAVGFPTMNTNQWISGNTNWDSNWNSRRYRRSADGIRDENKENVDSDVRNKRQHYWDNNYGDTWSSGAGFPTAFANPWTSNNNLWGSNWNSRRYQRSADGMSEANKENVDSDVRNKRQNYLGRSFGNNWNSGAGFPMTLGNPWTSSNNWWGNNWNSRRYRRSTESIGDENKENVDSELRNKRQKYWDNSYGNTWSSGAGFPTTFGNPWTPNTNWWGSNWDSRRYRRSTDEMGDLSQEKSDSDVRNKRQSYWDNIFGQTWNKNWQTPNWPLGGASQYKPIFVLSPFVGSWTPNLGQNDFWNRNWNQPSSRYFRDTTNAQETKNSEDGDALRNKRSFNSDFMGRHNWNTNDYVTPQGDNPYTFSQGNFWNPSYGTNNRLSGPGQRFYRNIEENHSGDGKERPKREADDISRIKRFGNQFWNYQNYPPMSYANNWAQDPVYNTNHWFSPINPWYIPPRMTQFTNPWYNPFFFGVLRSLRQIKGADVNETTERGKREALSKGPRQAQWLDFNSNPFGYEGFGRDNQYSFGGMPFWFRNPAYSGQNGFRPWNPLGSWGSGVAPTGYEWIRGLRETDNNKDGQERPKREVWGNSFGQNEFDSGRSYGSNWNNPGYGGIDPTNLWSSDQRQLWITGRPGMFGQQWRTNPSFQWNRGFSGYPPMQSKRDSEGTQEAAQDKGETRTKRGADEASSQRNKRWWRYNGAGDIKPQYLNQAAWRVGVESSNLWYPQRGSDFWSDRMRGIPFRRKRDVSAEDPLKNKRWVPFDSQRDALSRYDWRNPGTSQWRSPTWFPGQGNQNFNLQNPGYSRWGTSGNQGSPYWNRAATYRRRRSLDDFARRSYTDSRSWYPSDGGASFRNADRPLSVPWNGFTSYYNDLNLSGQRDADWDSIARYPRADTEGSENNKN